MKIGMFLVLYGVLAASFFALSHILTLDLVSFAHAKTQLIIFIPAVLLFVALSRKIIALPSKIVFLILALGLFVSGFTFSSWTIKTNTVFYAPYIGDLNGAQTRIDRIEFEKNLHQIDPLISVASIFDTVNDRKEALSVIDNREDVKGVIWGTPRNLSLTLGTTLRSKKLNSTSLNDPLSELIVISEIDQIDFPSLPRFETLQLLAGIFSNNKEHLEESAKIIGLWRTTTLRSYVFFKLGTFQLIDSYKVKPLDSVKIQEAIDTLQTAYKFAPGRENLTLRRIIIGNLAVAHLVRGGLLHDSKEIGLARSLMIDAVRPRIPSDRTDQAFIDSKEIQRKNSIIYHQLVSE